MRKRCSSFKIISEYLTHSMKGRAVLCRFIRVTRCFRSKSSWITLACSPPPAGMALRASPLLGPIADGWEMKVGWAPPVHSERVLLGWLELIAEELTPILLSPMQFRFATKTLSLIKRFALYKSLSTSFLSTGFHTPRGPLSGGVLLSWTVVRDADLCGTTRRKTVNAIAGASIPLVAALQRSLS